MLKKQLLNLLPHLGILALLLLYCNIYYSDTISRLPFGFHAWAQGDRLALAFQFFDRGMNFFRPATFNLGSIDGVVGVEFPLQSYLAAALGLLFGREHIPIIFRLLDISITVTGLCFLFRTVYSLTKDFLISIFTPLFIFCSPVYVVYAGNYLPDPAAASLVFIAFYYLTRFLKSGALQPLIISICIATLATLVKSSSIIYLGGILFCGFYSTLFVQKNKRAVIIFMAVSLMAGIAIFANLQHINYLNKTYKSSLFLSTFRPFENWAEFISFIENEFKNNWITEYFLLAQYASIFFIVGCGLATKIALKEGISLKLPLPVFFLGVVVIFILFGSQFPVHDYYFIAIFIPLIAYLLVISLIAIKRLFHLLLFVRSVLGCPVRC